MEHYTISMVRSPTITDDEARRRVTACYRILFDLAAARQRAVGDGVTDDLAAAEDGLPVQMEGRAASG